MPGSLSHLRFVETVDDMQPIIVLNLFLPFFAALGQSASFSSSHEAFKRGLDKSVLDIIKHSDGGGDHRETAIMLAQVQAGQIERAASQPAVEPAQQLQAEEASASRDDALLQKLDKLGQELQKDLTDRQDAFHKGLKDQMQRFQEGHSKDLAANASLVRRQIGNLQRFTSLNHATPALQAPVMHYDDDEADDPWTDVDPPMSARSLAVTRGGNYRNDPRTPPARTDPSPSRPLNVPALAGALPAAPYQTGAPSSFGPRRDPYSGSRPATPHGTRGSAERDQRGRQIQYSGFAMNKYDDTTEKMREYCGWKSHDDYEKDLKLYPCKFCGGPHYTGHCHAAYCNSAECVAKWGELRAATRKAQVEALADAHHNRTARVACWGDLRPPMGDGYDQCCAVAGIEDSTPLDEVLARIEAVEGAYAHLGHEGR